jgi:hypothetical protein
VGDGDGGGGRAGDVWAVACSGGGATVVPSGGLAPAVAAAPMGRVWVSGFGGDCSPPAVEEVVGRRLAQRWSMGWWGGGRGRRGRSHWGKKTCGEEAVDRRKSSGDVEKSGA